MKKIIPFLLLITFSAISFSQQINPTPALSKQDYLQKSKKQKTGAWLLLSGGGVMTIIGTGLAIDDASATTSDALVTIFTFGTVQQVTPDKDNTTVANVLFFGGLAGMLGSIPLFKAAKRNNRKGMIISFSNQKISSIQKSTFAYQSTHSLNLKISL